MTSHRCCRVSSCPAPEALLRLRKPPFHHFELLPPQAATWQSRAPRPGTYCPRVDARSLSFCRHRIRGHTRTHTSADFRTFDRRSLEDNSGREGERLPAAGYWGRILRTVPEESFLRILRVFPWLPGPLPRRSHRVHVPVSFPDVIGLPHGRLGRLPATFHERNFS